MNRIQTVLRSNSRNNKQIRRHSSYGSRSVPEPGSPFGSWFSLNSMTDSHADHYKIGGNSGFLNESISNNINTMNKNKFINMTNQESWKIAYDFQNQQQQQQNYQNHLNYKNSDKFLYVKIK